MDLGYDCRALTNGTAHSLDRAGAYVSHCEHTWYAGLQRAHVRRAAVTKVNAGPHEAMVVHRHIAAPEPLGFRLGSDKHEQVARWAVVLIASAGVTPCGAF
jgi:hypothetical protein